MSEDEATNREIEPMARIVSWAQVGVSVDYGSGPIPASRSALERQDGRSTTSTL